jgi:predicted NBD/HSP70 family sugar kinase
LEISGYEKLIHHSNSKGSTSFEQMIDHAQKGEKIAQSALKETAHYLGIGIANLIQGLALEAVIVGGPMVRAWPLIAEDTKRAVEESLCRGFPRAYYCLHPGRAADVDGSAQLNPRS